MAIDILKKRYVTSCYSEHDHSLACLTIKSELNRMLAPDVVSFQFDEIHTCDPFEKIHLSNGQTNSGMEDGYHATVLHEAWMPIWVADDKSKRIFYFVQFTHGRIIHGLAWIDYASVGFSKTSKPACFTLIMDEVGRSLVIDFNDSTLRKKSYGIYGEKGFNGCTDRVGSMHFGLYKHCDETQPQSSLDSITAIVRLMNNAYRILPKIINKLSQINQSIKSQKGMKKFLLMLLGALMSLPALARDFTYEYKEQTLTYTVIDEDAKTCMTKAGSFGEDTTAGNSVSGQLEIPTKVSDGENDFTVTSIGEYGFYRSMGMTSVTIPSTVTSIGNNAFQMCGFSLIIIPEGVTVIGSRAFDGCGALTSVSIPSSVISIGNEAFNACQALTKAEFASIESLCKIIFADSMANPLRTARHLYINDEEVTDVVIPSSVTSIGNFTFTYFTGMTSVEIPEGVAEIGIYAFNGCSGLSSVDIPEGVTSIGDYAFNECYKLTSASIPSSVNKIGFFAFSRCSGLTSVSIPEGITEIEGGTFSFCKGLTSVKIPSNVTSIGDSAFSNCTGLTSISISEGVTSIGYGAFSNCTGLPSISIPSSVISIGDNAFYGCTGLTSVTIPSNVTSIGQYGFYDCSGLISIFYNTDEPIETDSYTFDETTYTDATLYVRSEAVERCNQIYPWKNFKKIEEYDFLAGVEDAVADFEEDAPYEVYNLNGVKVDDSIDALAPGLYIVRQGRAVKKITVK